MHLRSMTTSVRMRIAHARITADNISCSVLTAVEKGLLGEQGAILSRNDGKHFQS